MSAMRINTYPGYMRTAVAFLVLLHDSAASTAATKKNDDTLSNQVFFFPSILGSMSHSI